MEKTGVDYATAIDLTYGKVGANTDTRDWVAIMQSKDPVAAAKAGLAQMYSDPKLPVPDGYSTGFQGGTVIAQTPRLGVIAENSGYKNVPLYQLQILGANGVPITAINSGTDPATISNLLSEFGVSQDEYNKIAPTFAGKQQATMDSFNAASAGQNAQRGGAIVDKALNISRSARAKGGSIKNMAKTVQSKGRNGDTILAHINPHEAAMLKKMGGSGRINPDTGLMSFDSDGITTTTVDTTNPDQTYLDALNQAYQQDFGRAYNPKTDSYWLDQLKSGAVTTGNLPSMMVSGAQSSDKTYAQNINTLKNLYQQNFLRPYDPATDSYWMQKLQAGTEDPVNLARDVLAGATGRDKLTYATYNPPAQTQVVKPVQQTPSGYNPNLGRYVFNQPNLITQAPLMQQNLANANGAGNNGIAPASAPPSTSTLAAYTDAYNNVMQNPHYSAAASTGKKRGGSTGSFIKKAIMVVSENKPKRSKRKG